MTHRDAIVQAFAMNGYRMTLGFILKHSWGYEFRARATELRREGWTIDCIKGKTASDNVYLASPPDSTGQMTMAI